MNPLVDLYACMHSKMTEMAKILRELTNFENRIAIYLAPKIGTSLQSIPSISSFQETVRIPPLKISPSCVSSADTPPLPIRPPNPSSLMRDIAADTPPLPNRPANSFALKQELEWISKRLLETKQDIRAFLQDGELDRLLKYSPYNDSEFYEKFFMKFFNLIDSDVLSRFETSDMLLDSPPCGGTSTTQQVRLTRQPRIVSHEIYEKILHCRERYENRRRGRRPYIPFNPVIPVPQFCSCFNVISDSGKNLQ